MKEETPRAAGLAKIIGIDQLRYLFALWVFFQHGGAPPLFAGHTATPELNLLARVYDLTINGQAAVIGFFVVSGLCIHFPYARGKQLQIGSFYVSRLLRLSLPLIAIILIARLLNLTTNQDLTNAVPIWTLYAEAIYYLAYPFILKITQKGKLNYLIALSFLVSVSLMILWSDNRTMFFHQIDGGGFLYWKAALLAFPCWLLGVKLGGKIDLQDHQLKARFKLRLWIARAGAFTLPMFFFPLYRVGVYLNQINNPFTGLLFSTQFTLLLFGIYVMKWIDLEIRHYNRSGATYPGLLEKMGAWSYSFYLVHSSVNWLVERWFTVTTPGILAGWVVLCVAVHLAMFCFYRLVEKPSHLASKAIGRYLERAGYY